eukprot:Sspe_Gene.53454::Locus_29544_Transcript_1_1_Confidence_1.000_Length_646::g.53454::m.53454/K14016/UFD1; ubiquitin fusion degradation protein 1
MSFSRKLKCFSGAVVDKTKVDEGGKILLPSSCFEALVTIKITYPMMFKITADSGISTHCGVLEFSADEGIAVLPFWMMQHLGVHQGDIIRIENASLKKGSYVKLRPQKKAFVELHNPKAVLENYLRNFSCLTEGDTICIKYAKQDFFIDILSVKSKEGQEKAISIVECDVNVDFDRPLDAPDTPPEKKLQPAKPSS